MPPTPDEGETMTQRDREMAEHIAQHTTARMIDALQNPDIAERVVGTWAGRVQQVVGRAVLRFVFYIVGIALLIGAIKAGVVDSILDTFQSKKG